MSRLSGLLILLGLVLAFIEAWPWGLALVAVLVAARRSDPPTRQGLHGGEDSPA